MASLSLPPDPYKLLGVSKDASLPEIRSAHRKLVLKCHPDKVQDATLKAIKQDEFQKVQEAYELLTDEGKRSEYDANVKLFELRKEMGRGNPGPRSNPFEYEVKTADPRPSSYGRPPPPKVYSYGPVPRSHEDMLYGESRHQPKKSASYDSTTDRNRAAEKEEARIRAEYLRKREEKREEEERIMRAREKDAKRVHSEKKKSRDKEKRRGTDEKRSRTTGPFVEDDSDDEYITRSSEKKPSRHRMDEKIRIEEEIRMREEQARAAEAIRAAEAARAQIKEAPMDPKWNEHMDFAGKYMQAARRKGAAEEAAFQHPGVRRADTYAAPGTPYNVRHATPQYSDDDSPRRSSGHKETRRASETTSTRRDRSRSRRSPSRSREPYIVEPSSPPPRMKPTFQSHSSAPPTLPREKPSRSKTQDYPRADGIPPLPRANTFQVNERGRDREYHSSGLRKEVPPSDSESDTPYRSSPPRHSSSPPPPRRAETRYFVQESRAVPIPNTSRHRTDLHNLNENYVPRDRSESPRGTPGRPPLTRNPPSSESKPRTSPRIHSYYTTPPEAPEPVILTARPKIHREPSNSRGPKYDHIAYSPAYTPHDVKFSARPGPDLYERTRRGPEYYQTGRAGVYASG